MQVNLFLVIVVLLVYCKVDCANPTVVKVFENETVILPCYVNESEEDFRVRWLKNTTLLGDTSVPFHLLPERHRMWPNSSLQIDKVVPADTANYTCEIVRQDSLSTLKQTYTVEVQYAPIITTIPEDGYLEVQKGEYVDIGCNVSSNPTYTLSWIKNGKPLELRDQRHRMRFKAESRSLAGAYECEVSNGIGVAVRGAIKVVILDAPVVWCRQSWVHTSPGLKAVLEATLEFANPPATTTWSRNGVLLHSDDRVKMVTSEHTHKLVIRNVRESDLTNYTFRAENRFGMADVSFTLSGVPNVATFKMDPTLNKATATTFMLVWEVDSYSVIIEYNLWVRPYAAHSQGVRFVTEDPRHNRWRKIVVPGSDGGVGPIHSTSYVVSGLTPGMVYEAFVTSRNRFGWSKSSSLVRFPTVTGVTTPTPQTEVETPAIEEIIERANVSEQTQAYESGGNILYYKLSMVLCLTKFLIYALG